MSHRPSQPPHRTRACPAAYDPVVKKTSASKPSLSFSGWRSGDGYPHIVMTSDGGNTWVDIAGKKLPQAPINDVIRHSSKPKWLFIATDVGVFRTTNLGKTWIKVGDNLPLVPVNDIDLPAGSDTLYAATYGRSVWTTSLADIS